MDFDSYRITTEAGKKVVEMIRELLADEVPLRGFLDKLEEFTLRSEEEFTDGEVCYADEVWREFEFYEPKYYIRATNPLLVNEEGLRQRLKKFLDASLIEDV